MAANGRYSLPPGGYDGRNGDSTKPGATPLPHIDDILAIPKDIDPNQSIRRLLDQAESSLRQSEMSRDFNRPALALKDYIRACVIAVQTISKHQDYPALRSTQGGDIARLHTSLLKRIDQQSDTYDRIKRDIIADNKMSGVQPTIRSSKASPTTNGPLSGSSPASHNIGGRPRQSSIPNGHATHLKNDSPAKSKPAVHPKPSSLHGNAIPPGHHRANSTSNATLDLAARFANLRGPQASPGQDPRIKTYSIIPQKPVGPREMPPSPQKISIDTSNAATLPKLPDAIYSPARGSVSGEAARLPTSTPRGLFSRTGSSTSLANTPSLAQPRQSNEYFPPVPPTASARSSVSETVFDIPDGDTITPEQLYTLKKTKASILLIDIRARDDFDDGHIMASSIICIEPSILLRDSISSSDISDSLVLSPNPEHYLFEKRDSYDLVVFYDQASELIPQTQKSSDDEVVVSLHRALVLLNYGRELKNSPKLLKGGLDAWVDLMGSRSLQSTPSGASKTSQTKARHGLIRRKGSKYTVTPLQSEEDIKAWQKTLDKDATRPTFPRTGDEFLRFPPISTERQSMASTMSAEQRYKQDMTNRFASPTQLPPPPARPQAAVQRPSHSGLSQNDHEEDELATQPRKAQEHLYYTGLNNPRNWCYANSTLQSLLASPGFGRELADRAWERQYKNRVPMKESEKRDQPQLMIQMISNLFHWMSSGKFETMKAQMLMEYSRHLCKRSDFQFGGEDQQDAQEFMSFIMDQLHEETNLLRNLKGKVEQPDMKGQSLVRAAAKVWRSHCRLNDSIVDRYWRGLELSTVQCKQCDNLTYNYSQFEWLPVTVQGGDDMTLAEALQKTTGDNELDDFKCDNCNNKGRAIQKMCLARMPQLLCLSFRRFDFDYNAGEGRPTKNNAVVTWDFNDFDFTPWFLDSASASEGRSMDDKGFSGPFKYECYAVIVHAGRSVNSGHYYAYVRDSSTHGQDAWLFCNDSVVERVRIGSRKSDDIQNYVFKSGQDKVPYLAFFRRKGA
ncbi:ubiquitin-specific protease doa4 [Conoideocrella luteorostrata]|uniref:Ubiquitin-specific protease doa4 n=1 Tax=Conoideocrella luteorostrata TaxID=1105319 RepID=A0AAJ0CCV2_9HYPO|nr:ubiquitin-specific protease doa4 [Conoideocrella luteorostrata]